MNDELKSKLKANVSPTYSSQRSLKTKNIKGTYATFYVMAVCMMALDLAVAIKSLIVGTTIAGAALHWATFAAEVICFAAMVLPRLQYDYTTHVGAAFLFVAFALPFSGLINDIVVFLGVADGIVLALRAALYALFSIVYFRSLEKSLDLRKTVTFVVFPVIMTLCLLSVFVMDQDMAGAENYDVRYTYASNDDGTVTLTGYSGLSLIKSYSIPSKISGKEVSALGSRFAEKLRGVDELVLPNTISNIDERAFEGNDEIKKITILNTQPQSLAFADYSNVECVRFENGVENMSAIADTFKKQNLIINVPDDKYNDVRKEMFDAGNQNTLHIYPTTPGAYVINFNSNNNEYIDSVVETSYVDVLNRTREVIESSKDIVYGLSPRAHANRWYYSADFAAGTEYDSLVTNRYNQSALNPDVYACHRADLYLRWEPIYNIYYRSALGNKTVSFSALDAELTLPEQQREGYTFMGWFDSASYLNKVTELSVYETRDRYLYAKFNKNYSLKFDCGEGAFEDDELPTFYHTEMTVELPKVTPKRGYTFDGWAVSGIGFPTMSIQPGETGNKNFVAKFTPITYTLNFSTYWAGHTRQKITYTVEDQNIDLTGFTLTSPNGGRAGFDFAGWQLNGERVLEWDVMRLTDGDVTEATLEASWSIANFDVKLKEIETSSVVYGDVITLEADTSGLATDNELSYTYAWHKKDPRGDKPVGSSPTLTLSTVADSGDYYLTIQATYTRAEQNPKEGTAKLGLNEANGIVIQPRPVNIEWELANDVYDKQEKTPVPSVSNLVNGDEQNCELAAQLVEGGDNVNVTAEGFSFRVTEVKNPNYTLDEGVDLEHKFIIKPKTAEFSWDWEIDDVYSGQAKQLVASVNNLCEDDECEVTEVELVEGDDNLHVTAEGFRYKAVRLGNPNYAMPQDDASTSDPFFISPLPVELSWTPNEFVYDSNDKAVAATVENLANSDACTVAEYTHEGDIKNVTDEGFTFTAIRLEGEDSANYTLEKGTNVTSEKYDIKPIVVELEWTEPENLVYDGEDKSATAAVTNLAGEDSCTVDGYSHDGNIKNVTLEGFTFTATMLSSKNYTLQEANVTSPTYNIKPLPVVVEWTYIYTYYEGRAKDPTPRVSNLAEGDRCELEKQFVSGDNVNVTEGGFTYQVTEVKNSDYTLDGGTDVEKTFKIDMIYAKFDWQLDDLEYNGQPKEPTAKVSNNFGNEINVSIIKQSGDNINVSEEGFKYKVVSIDSTNYIVSNYEIKEFSIEPRPVVLEWTLPNNLTYTGNEKNATAKVTNLVNSDACAVTEYSHNGDNVNVTHSPVTFTATNLDNPNYTLAGGDKITSGEFEILPIVVRLSWQGRPGADWTFNGEPKSSNVNVTVTNVLHGEVCRVSTYYSPVEDIEVTDEGFSLTAATLDNPNYTLVGCDSAESGKFHITPKVISLHWEQLDGLVYDGTEKEPTATVSGVYQKYPCAVTEYRCNGSNIDAGEFTRTATTLSSKNYTLVGCATATSGTYKIEPRMVELKWTAPADLVYDGKAKQATAEVTNLIGHDQCTVTNYSHDGDNVTVTEKGFTFTATALSNKNYTLNGCKNATSDTYKIQPLAAELEWTHPTRGEYDGSHKQLTATVTNCVYVDWRQEKCKVTDYTTIGDNLNVTTEGYAYKATVLDNHNYTLVGCQNATSPTYHITPRVAALTWTYTDPESLVYDGSQKRATARVTNYNHPDEVRVDDYSVNGDNINVTEEGFTLTATKLAGKGSENFTLDGSRTVTSETYHITPKTVMLEWITPANLVYDGNEKVATATVASLVKQDDCTVSDYSHDGDNINVTGGGFTFTATALSNKNYTLSGCANATSKKYKIEPRTVEVKWTAPDDLNYNGEVKTPTAEIENLVGSDDCTLKIELASGNGIEGEFAYHVVGLEGEKAGNYKLPQDGEDGFEGLTSDTYTIVGGALSPQKMSLSNLLG